VNAKEEIAGQGDTVGDQREESGPTRSDGGSGSIHRQKEKMTGHRLGEAQRGTHVVAGSLEDGDYLNGRLEGVRASLSARRKA